MRVDTMTLLCLLLFVGAMGKSAQLGLHTWLPDAMEGPTPVSALIHAATMVTAGVFMVCRLSPMFETSQTALTVVTYVGAATAFFAATIGVVQTDIKRVIAYSTCSQLGYMFFGAGVGAFGGAMFHLFTHAFFKALLFLCAGSVIHAMHHEQDMRFYGGLRKHIPWTFWTMLAGTLAITGVGIEEVFGFAGFYSKDAIISAAYARGTTAGGIAYFIGVTAALLTSFYSWRLVFLTFYGEPRWAASEHIQHVLHDAHGHDDHGHDHDHAHHDAHHDQPDEGAGAEPSVDSRGAEDMPKGTGGYHPHESPLNMLIPLVVLAIGAVFAGWGFAKPFIGEGGTAFWQGSLWFNPEFMESIEHIPFAAKSMASVAMLVGLLLALWAYVWDKSLPSRVAGSARGLYAFLLNKWYFDELYDFLFVRPAFALGRLLWKRGDQGTIDRFGPNGAAWLVQATGVVSRKMQSGYVYTYALVMLLGLAAAATWVMAS
jgi:NADH-quinone oxidoreductase subunit L